DADADVAREVDPRLDRHDVPRLEHRVRLGPHVRLLVDGKADAVTEPVAVVLGHPGLADRLPGHSVDVLAEGARLDGRERVELRRETEVVEVAEAALRLAGEEGPRAVRPVAVE